MIYQAQRPIGLPNRVAMPGDSVAADEVAEEAVRLVELGALTLIEGEPEPAKSSKARKEA